MSKEITKDIDTSGSKGTIFKFTAFVVIGETKTSFTGCFCPPQLNQFESLYRTLTSVQVDNKMLCIISC